MKRTVFILIFITGMTFSLPAETWLYLGFEYGNLFDTYLEQEETVSSYMSSLGLNLGGYVFFDEKNTGLFIHNFFAVPVTGYKEINGVSKDNEYDNPFQIGLILGPGFRYNFTENFVLKGAIGLNLLMSWLNYSGYIPTYGDILYETFRCDFGVGGDIGLKINLTRDFFLNFGSIFTFDFFRYIIMDTSFKKRSMGRMEDFYMFEVRPYITVGFNIGGEH